MSIRFEEFKDAGVAKAQKTAFKKPPIKMSGKSDSAAPLVVVDDPLAPDGVLRKLVTFPGSSNKAPSDTTSSADRLTFDLGAIVPKDLTIGLNGARKASVASVTLRFADCPLDPRTIRSCAVSIYVGTIAQADFDKAARAGADGAADPVNVLPATYVDEVGNQRTNLRFQGWVDDWEVTFDDDNEPVVKIECRDNTTLLEAQQHPPRMVVDGSLPLHEALAKYLSHFPQFAGMSVEYRPSGMDPPKLNDALSKTAFRPNLGPAAKGGGGKTTSLDYLTDVCGSVGHIIYVEGTLLVVRMVRSLTGEEFAGRDNDPYKGRSLPSGEAKFRRFIYGRNVKSMSCKRKFAKTAPTNVEVRCYDPARKKVLVARFPLKDSPVSNPPPGDAKEQKWAVHYVSGIKDQTTLDRIAQGYYESIGRGELEVSVKTHNLASFGGGNLDPDILDMLAGDSFEVLVNRDEDESSTVAKIESILAAQGRVEEFMQGQGYSTEFAAAFAASFSNTAFPTLFRLRHLGIAWSCDEGIELTIEGINYVEVRLDVNLPPGEAVTGGKGGTKA